MRIYPVASASPEKALERFLRQNDSPLQAERFERMGSESGPTFELRAESVGPVRIETTRIKRGRIVVAYKACRGTF